MKLIKESEIVKIATYNIWTSDRGMPARENQIVQEINALDADIIAIQEVKNKDMHERLIEGTGYNYSGFAPHEGKVIANETYRLDEGLAVYSKHPITYVKYIDYILIVVVEHKGNSILLANVHLPYDSVLAKEACIVKLIKETSEIAADFRFILGDFNCTETSSVHMYLKGDLSLNGTEVTPYWTDLAYVGRGVPGCKKGADFGFENQSPVERPNPNG